MYFTDILIKKNIITEDELIKISKKSTKDGVEIEELLKTHGISEEEINQAKSEALNIPFRSIKEKKIPFEILKQIPEEAARYYKFVPLGIENGVLEIGMVEPNNIESKEALKFIATKLNLPFNIFLISKNDLDEVLSGYKGLSGEVTKVLGELESELSDAIKEKDTDDILSKTESKFVEDAPVTKMVAVVLKHAVSGGASDIHIEPLREKLRVRFRVDGILYTSLFLPLDVREAIVSRIKILTNMKLDEKRKPQDGRFEARIDGKEIDFRVSTLPTFFGEKVAIRVLDKQKGIKTLSDLGLFGENLEIIKDALKKPYGMILLTGPTGSGKSTTLYAMLQELDKEKKNIISLEDPVEYNIEGLNQSQVKPELGYSFASGLRSILRQDPDMIMVGEIRDKETAALAVQAALTGHMVFSTLHTNSASGVVTRLMDMDVDPFLIAPTLTLSIGQRLVRRLCPNSVKEIPLIGKLKERIEEGISNVPLKTRKSFKMPSHVYQGIPSTECPQGFKGRIGIFEILSNTKELERIILTNPIEPEIIKEARRQGMLTMHENTIRKILEGKISVDELNKV